MNTILNIGKTGLKSTQNKMDSVADDLANVNTNGYKKKEVSFQELLHNGISDYEVLKSPNVNNASINAGSKSSIGSVNFEQGNILESSGEFHMAIDGMGFFGVRDESGKLMLTRNGGFHKNEDNSITDDSGNLLDMEIYLPKEHWGNNIVSISNTGDIMVNIDEENILLGKVVIYNPKVLDSLIPMGEGKFQPSPNAMLYNSLIDGDDFGNVVQYSLEASNVEMGKGMVDMIITQRAYSLNAKTIQTTDEIMGMINNIKR